MTNASNWDHVIPVGDGQLSVDMILMIVVLVAAWAIILHLLADSYE